MAKRVHVTLTDDLSGDDIDLDIVSQPTVTFAVDGVEYEIDLGQKNQDKFRKALDPFIASSRRVGGRKKPVNKAAGVNGSAIADSAKARAWALENGLDVPSRGRVSQALIDKWRTATA
ncbi:Lsr2 family protein [Nocardia sp. NPDC059180]|uniref:histone-like nucleoid-structuring protein Lsr2 n=1 Tax=Nocardia sp. NPDC059180 TaxID=3346761 RepID=UPI00369FEB2E